MTDPTTIWLVTQGLARRPVLWRMTEEDAGVAVRALDPHQYKSLETHLVSEVPALLTPLEIDYAREAAALRTRMYEATGYAPRVELFVHPAVWHSIAATAQSPMISMGYHMRRIEIYEGIILRQTP